MAVLDRASPVAASPTSRWTGLATGNVRVMACIVMGYIFMARIVMAYIVIACIVLAYVITAYIVMAYMDTVHSLTCLANENVLDRGLASSAIDGADGAR